jgi:hypothetical protein
VNKVSLTNTGPNVADLLTDYKIIRPLIETPFLPTEVEKLSKAPRIVDEIPMTNALLVGNVERNNGLEEVNNINNRNHHYIIQSFRVILLLYLILFHKDKIFRLLQKLLQFLEL